MEVDELIETNYNLSRFIEELIPKIELEDDKNRDMILSGFFNNARIHFYSMNLSILCSTCTK